MTRTIQEGPIIDEWPRPVRFAYAGGWYVGWPYSAEYIFNMDILMTLFPLGTILERDQEERCVYASMHKGDDGDDLCWSRDTYLVRDSAGRLSVLPAEEVEEELQKDSQQRKSKIYKHVPCETTATVTPEPEPESEYKPPSRISRNYSVMWPGVGPATLWVFAQGEYLECQRVEALFPGSQVAITKVSPDAAVRPIRVSVFGSHGNFSVYSGCVVVVATRSGERRVYSLAEAEKIFGVLL